MFIALQKLCLKFFGLEQDPHQSGETSHHFLLLQIGLAIQIGRFHVTHAIRVGRVQEQDVCWDDLIGEHLDKIPHPYILPSFLNKAPLAPGKRQTDTQLVTWSPIVHKPALN